MSMPRARALFSASLINIMDSNNRCIYRYGRCKINRSYRSRSRSRRLTAAEDYDFRNNWTREQLAAEAERYAVQGWQHLSDRRRYTALRNLGVIVLGQGYAAYVPSSTPSPDTGFYAMMR
jgi:hypothetical protein